MQISNSLLTKWGEALANPSPWGEGSQNFCPLSIRERARVRVNSVLHISIQQRLPHF